MNKEWGGEVTGNGKVGIARSVPLRRQKEQGGGEMEGGDTNRFIVFG